ncbi:MAG: transporter [Bacteroidia bacterium]|nr:transporter [Bacteroidia bacterium]
MKTLLQVLALLFPLLSFGQYNQDIQSDRPGKAILGQSPGARVFQLQMGYSFQRIKITGVTTHALTQATVFRVGVTERVELNSRVDWRVEDTTFPTDGVEYKAGISRTQFGTRLSLLQNKGWIPALGLQTGLLLRGESRPYWKRGLGSEFILITGNKISDRISFNTNWGFRKEDEQTPAKFSYVFNLTFFLSKNIGSFAEVYGDFGDANPSFDTGFFCRVNPDFQVDVASGWQGDGMISDWFLNLGLSWRLDWRN